MTNGNVTLESMVEAVTRALSAAGYASEPDPTNNTLNAPAYLKIFCKNVPKRRRVDYLNLVFRDLAGEQVSIEGDDSIYAVPGDLNALIERVRHNLPCP